MNEQTVEEMGPFHLALFGSLFFEFSELRALGGEALLPREV